MTRPDKPGVTVEDFQKRFPGKITYHQKTVEAQQFDLEVTHVKVLDPQIDAVAANEFLKKFFAGTKHPIELRSIPGRHRIFTRTLREITSFLLENQRENLYFGVSTREGGGSKEHCREVPALFSDVDAADSETLKRIEAFVPDPSIIVSSGGGFHLYWLLAKPIDAQDSRIEPILKGLCAALCADKSSAELARILRIPGTFNFKPKYPEPQPVFSTRENWDSRYQVDDFLQFVPANGNEKHAAAPPIAGEIPEGQRRKDLLSMAGSMRRRGAGVEEILAALREMNNRRCKPPLEESEVRAIAKDIPYRYQPHVEDEVKHPEPPVEVCTATEDRLTEAGAAERLARLHGDDVRFDHRRGHWLMWERHRWRRDADASITRLALDFARTWQHEAVDVEDHEKREAILKAALRLERRDGLASMLTLAHDLKPIADAGNDWDAQPHLLGVPNGVVDLHTAELRAGRPEDRITMQTRAQYNSDAACPRWERFLSEIFDSPELISFVHRAIGYSLTGDTSEQCLVMGYGTGSNGKGTLMNTVKWVLGDYGWNMPFATIEANDRNSIPNDVAALCGRRFVVASETNDGTRLNEGRIKALTGCDPITARFLHKEFFEFQPVAKFWLSVNHKPVVRDDSHGFWRRIRLIPFLQTFPINPSLEDELRSEAPGILAWAIRGCLRWRQERLDPPTIITEATQQYAKDSDPLAPFLEQACDLDPESETGASELFKHYRRWCDDRAMNEKERLSATMFGRKVSERFERRHTRNGALYQGVATRLVTGFSQ